MPMLVNRAVVYAKSEATEGVDPTPTTASAILVSNPQIVINADSNQRDIARKSLGSLGFVPGVRSAQITFQTELRGLGTATYAAANFRDDPLWQACGMSLSYAVNSSSVTIKPVSDHSAGSTKTATIYAFLDGVAYAIGATRGAWAISMDDGQFGKINWTLNGILTAAIPSGAGNPTAGSMSPIADVALPAANYINLGLEPPPLLGATFTLNSVTLPNPSSFSIESGNDVQQRMDFTKANGISGFLIRNRNINGSFQIEAVQKATSGLDFWYYWQQTTTPGALSLALGTALNQIQFDVPAPQFDKPSWQDRNGVRAWDVPYTAVQQSDAGDDELTITFK